MGIERFVGGCSPLGSRRGATLAALVDRQLQRIDQVLDLVAGGYMRGALPSMLSSTSSSAVNPRGKYSR
jgi:hypothetical protein